MNHRPKPKSENCDTLKSNLALPQKVKHKVKHTTQQAIPSQGKENMYPHTPTYTQINNGTIYNNQKVETTQISIN